MARLENTDGTYIDLKPIAYQFPEGEGSLNWLQIQLQANDGQYEWQAIDPAFENHELTDFIGWIRGHVNGEENIKPTFYATEPCVEFEAKHRENLLVLIVWLGYEFLPMPLRGKKDSYHKKVKLVFEKTKQDFLDFVSALEKELALFPLRDEKDDEE